MADERITSALRRYFSRQEIDTAYKAAFAAYQERNTEVVITSMNMGGGGGTGQITGDPADLMDACECVLQEMDAADAGDTLVAGGPPASDFSRRYVGT